MAVFGDLGGQPIELNNAAEESTLQRIASILEGQRGGGGAAGVQEANQKAAADRKAASEAQNLGSAAGVASAGLYDSARAARMYNQASQDFSRGMTSMSSNFASADPFAFSQSLITTIGGVAGSVAQAAGDAVPIIGGALGSLAKAGIGAAAMLGGAFIGALSKTVGSFNTAQKAGALLGGDLIAFRDAANGSGLTLDQFNGVLSKTGASMASFGGQTTKGASAFGKANSAFISGFGEQMLRMGMDYESQGIATAEYMETLQLSGMSLGQMALRADQVAAGTARLAKQQKMLAAINGQTVEQQKAAQKQARTDAAFQAAISGMSVKQRTEMEALITQFPHLAQSIKETIVTGDTVSAEGILAAQAAGKAGEIVLEGVRNIANDVAPEEQVTAIYRNLETNAAEIQRDTAAAADTVKLGILGVGGAFVNAYEKQFLPLQRQSTQAGAEVFSNVQKDMEKLSESGTAATKAMTDIAKSTQEAQQAVSKAVTDLMKSNFGGTLASLTAWPVKTLAGLITGLPDLTKKMADIANNRTTNTPDASTATQTTQTFADDDDYRIGATGEFGTPGTEAATANVTAPIVTSDPAMATAVAQLSRKIDNQTVDIVRALQSN